MTAPADDCSVCREVGGPHGVPAAAEPTDELREEVARYLSEQFGEYPVRSLIPWRTEADALLSGPLAPLLELRGVLADLTEAVGRGDEHGLPEAYRAACRVLRHS